MASLIGVAGLSKTSAGFRKALYEGAIARGFNPDHLAAVMSFESGFNPAAKNAHSGALGLIQWVSDSSFASTARAAGQPSVTRSDLPSMTATEQLPFVFAWFSGKGLTKSSSVIDYYLAVFMPAHIGKARSTVVAREGTLAYSQNIGFDRDKKGYYTIADIGRSIESVVAKGNAQPRVPVDFAASELESKPLSPLVIALACAAGAWWLWPRLGAVRRLVGA
jgi:Transglycosylase SLT domain